MPSFSIHIPLLFICIGIAGCGNESTSPDTVEQPTAVPQASPVSRVDDPNVTVESPMSQPDPVPEQVPIPSISLSGSTDSNSTTETVADPKDKATEADRKRRELLAAMKPVQIMLGQWRGTTQKQVGDFKALSEPEWIWDFQTNRNQPEMVMTSDESPYFKTARLTYLTDDKIFHMKTTGPDGKERIFKGAFSKPVEEFQGDDQKMHVKYDLQLKQTNGESPRETWQVTFNQQDNHRYLVELARQSGSNFIRFDTVATQRQGTSFAKNDVGYGERECIISGGLGTSQVSYKGKSYWVCCSGCRAAFDEDPESWITEYQAKLAAKGDL